jgi:AAA+ superfamily predicted ATPase
MRKATERRRASSTGRPASSTRPAATPAGFALRAALGCLDQLLGARLEQAEREFSPAGALDALRGLHISAADARRALRGADTLAPAAQETQRIAALLGADPAFGRLVEQHALDEFHVMTLLIALAPEIDLRYQKVFGYLQDDVTKKRPTVDLVLSLLCPDDAERYARRAEFAADGRLISRQIVELVPDPNYVAPPLLAQYVTPDEQIVRFLLGDTGLDSRLAGACRMVEPRATLADTHLSKSHEELCRALQARVPVWLHGPEGVGKATLAGSLAEALRQPQLVLDAGRVAPPDMEKVLRLAQREAALRQAQLYVSRPEAWLQDVQALTRLVSAVGGQLVFGALQSPPAPLLGAVQAIEIPLPDIAQRVRYWRNAFIAGGLKVDEQLVAQLGRRFRLTPAQIASAAEAAHRGDSDPFAAARAQRGDALATVATKIDLRAVWDDLVLPDDATQQLRELCARVDCQAQVFEEWGFARKLSRGRGTSALFSGGSGTGKTMAAEVIANSLGLDLYRIDLARVVSKYIGETEKNLERVFAAAEGANAILFFDEADALFGKRSEVKDARDRYANIEVSYLLQRIEDYDGIAILASNLAENLDAAFTRRLAFNVFFPFPDESARLRIWERVWPAATPIEPSVDRGALARDVRLAGAGIKNVALAAAFAAARNGTAVDAAHVRHAVLREHQKSGRIAPGTAA